MGDLQEMSFDIIRFKFPSHCLLFVFYFADMNADASRTRGETLLE